MSDRQRYTLDEARRELARRECAMHGHDVETILIVQTGQPRLLLCARCGQSWDVAPHVDRDKDGQRLYVLLALFDTRDGSPLADVIQAAREGWERSHPDMAEDDAWDQFDRLWAAFREDDTRNQVRAWAARRL